MQNSLPSLIAVRCWQGKPCRHVGANRKWWWCEMKWGDASARRGWAWGGACWWLGRWAVWRAPPTTLLPTAFASCHGHTLELRPGTTGCGGSSLGLRREHTTCSAGRHRCTYNLSEQLRLFTFVQVQSFACILKAAGSKTCHCKMPTEQAIRRMLAEQHRQRGAYDPARLAPISPRHAARRTRLGRAGRTSSKPAGGMRMVKRDDTALAEQDVLNAVIDAAKPSEDVELPPAPAVPGAAPRSHPPSAPDHSAPSRIPICRLRRTIRVRRLRSTRFRPLLHIRAPKWPPHLIPLLLQRVRDQRLHFLRRPTSAPNGTTPVDAQSSSGAGPADPSAGGDRSHHTMVAGDARAKRRGEGEKNSCQLASKSQRLHSLDGRQMSTPTHQPSKRLSPYAAHTDSNETLVNITPLAAALTYEKPMSHAIAPGSNRVASAAGQRGLESGRVAMPRDRSASSAEFDRRGARDPHRHLDAL
ncbi:hypothetical protein L1887_61347 [Cichorium endivia]|nr:hypothetical protein L1887_61347 [Cichorium endivia]